jgi:transposase
MQTDYRYNWIREYKRFARFCYRFGMISEEANRRYKIIQFLDKYGIEAAIEADGVSRRTLYRWKSTFKNSNGDIASLNPKSTKPHKKREPQTPKEIIERIRRLRKEYSNIGKEKIHYMLKGWCKSKKLKLPSVSTIGRIISRDKDKMRFTPLNIDHNGKIKPKKRKLKNRKPKNLKSEPMHLWAVDTIQRVSNGIRRYIMTMIDPNSRIAFAVAIPSEHSKHTAKILEALIDGLSGSIAFKTNRTL